MRIVYTKKGLEIRNKLKQEIFEREREVIPASLLQVNRSNESINLNRIASLTRSGQNDVEKSLKLPKFETMKVELIKTPVGEYKERPFMLANEQINKAKYEVTEIDLNNNNTSVLQDLLNERPKHLHKKASEGMILPPKQTIKTTSFLDIIGTIESPSHWRYFENKKKQRTTNLSPANTNIETYKRNLPAMKTRHFSPEVNQQMYETSFPFNVEKILRKQAEEDERRQKL